MSRHSRFALLLVGIPCFVPAWGSASEVDRVLSGRSLLSHRERNRVLHRLTKEEMRSRESEFLEILERDTPLPGLSHDEFLVLKNDIADRLIQFDLLCADHLRQAIATLKNPDRDEVWRDYCLQKLPALLAAEGLAEADVQQGTRLVRDLSAGEIPGLVGTALIAARTLCTTRDSDWLHAPAEVADWALACAGDSEAELIDRVTALQIAAELGHPEAVACALPLLKPETPAMLRVSAIASLKYSEDPNLLTHVQPYRLSPDIRIRAAARATIDALTPTL